MDREEAQRLVDTYGDAVYRLAYARTGNRADAEDITQETFLRLIRAGPKFREEAHCKAWLLRVAANCAKDLHRSFWRNKVVSMEAVQTLSTENTAESSDLLEAVSTLPEAYRVVIHLHYYEGLSALEIARLLQISEGAVNTRLSRARVMLRNWLEEDESHAE